MENSYSIIQKESEYRILLTPANLCSLSANVLKVLADRNIDVSELIPHRSHRLLYLIGIERA